MVGELGTAALYVALPLGLYAAVAAILGQRPGRENWARSARMAVYGLTALATVAAASMTYLLYTSDFRYDYVARVTDRNLDPVYKITALWAGNEGSLLLWWWVLTGLTALVVSSRPAGDRELRPWATVALLLNGLFFLSLLLFVAPPFRRSPQEQVDGAGLNPLLQNPGMLLHPVFLYLGYVGFAIPWAYAVAALITCRVNDAWIKVTRRWTLLSWLFLTAGIVYGGQWAYVELGWGGYWAWDPVENASLMPWLTGTAFLHSVMIQERKGALKVWNVSLATVTFLLTLFGTFLTRSGILQSVHSFADSKLGAYFLGFVGLCLLASVYLIVERLPLLKSEAEFESTLSKESTFLLNNLVLTAMTFAVLWGTLFPIVSEWVTGTRVGVGPPFFNQVNVPFGILLIVLMGVGPVIAWRRATPANLKRQFLYPAAVGLASALTMVALGLRRPYPVLGLAASAFVLATIVQEFARGIRVRRRMTGESPAVAFVRLILRNRRRYGGYIVHLGVLLTVVGIIGSNTYKLEVTRTLRPGESMAVGAYSLTHLGLGLEEEGDRQHLYADLELSKNGKRLGVMRPEKVFHPGQEQPTTEVAIHGSLVEDVYVVLGGWDQDGSASIQVSVNPLVAWLWIGLYVLMAGTLLAMWPEPLPVRRGAEVGIRAQGALLGGARLSDGGLGLGLPARGGE